MKWLRSGQSFETNNAQIFSCQKHFQRLKKKLESISKECVQDKLLSNHWKSSELIKSRYSARSCFLCIICNVVLSDTELLLTAKLFLLFPPIPILFLNTTKSMWFRRNQNVNFTKTAKSQETKISCHIHELIRAMQQFKSGSLNCRYHFGATLT